MKSNHVSRVTASVLAIFLTASILAVNAYTATAQQQTGELTLKLWPEGTPGAKGDSTADIPTVTVFLPDDGEATGTGVVVFPGGGYSHLAVDHEGYAVARWLNEIGVAAFVVRYRLGERYRHPAQINDAHRAIRMVRANAAKWGVRTDRIGVLGFSAGGHLASTAGTHFGSAHPGAGNPLDRPATRPDFMVLVYPVITMQMDYTHRGSRFHLLGENPDRVLVSRLSNELQVSPETPPAFIVHGSNDRAVPVQNSIQFYRSLLDYGVSAEMHLFADGPHGFGLAPDNPVLSRWPEMCERWMRSMGYLPE